MKIGQVELDILSLERFRLDGGAMFGIVPKPLWEKSNPADPQNRIAMGCQCLLIRSEGRNILVDAGMGSKWDPKLQEIYSIDSGSQKLSSLERALAEHELKPVDITDVIVTHLHFDHAGGLTYKGVDGQLKPTLPNACHWIQASHLDWALSPTEKDRGSFPSENIEPLIKNDLFKLVRGEESLFSGIHLIPLYGHTHAMQAILIEGNPSVFYPTDLVPMVAHLHLPYIMAYDIEPLTTLKEKKRLLAQAQLENWHLIFEHEPEETSGPIETYKGKYRLSAPN